MQTMTQKATEQLSKIDIALADYSEWLNRVSNLGIEFEVEQLSKLANTLEDTQQLIKELASI